jgi:hypothetical protein
MGNQPVAVTKVIGNRRYLRSSSGCFATLAAILLA